MVIELIEERLENLIAEYTGKTKIEKEADLMARPTSLRPYTMAALFLDIEKEFSVDLNRLVPSLNLYSPKEIAKEVLCLVSGQDS